MGRAALPTGICRVSRKHFHGGWAAVKTPSQGLPGLLPALRSRIFKAPSVSVGLGSMLI